MIRKTFCLLVVLFVALVALGSPASSPPISAQDAPEIEWVCPPEFAGQQLNIYNWSLYIGEETIPTFEELCDVEVTYDVFDTTEALINRLREGNPGYDIVFPSDYMVRLFAEEDLLIPIDYEKIPNFANIADEFKDPAYDPDNGFSVPYQWGTSGIAYAVDSVDEPITSWVQMFEHDGPVGWLDDPGTMLAIGLIMTDNPPNPTDSDMIEEARDYLIDNSGNVRTIVVADMQILLETGELEMAVGYSGELFQLLQNCECEDYAYAIPEEGSNIYVDTMAIPVGAQNVELAHAFIDYMLDPVVGAINSNYIGYASPNRVSIEMELIDPAYLSNPVIYLPQETIENLYYLEQNPDFELDVLDAWDEIILSIGE